MAAGLCSGLVSIQGSHSLPTTQARLLQRLQETPASTTPKTLPRISPQQPSSPTLSPESPTAKKFRLFQSKKGRTAGDPPRPSTSSSRSERPSSSFSFPSPPIAAEKAKRITSSPSVTTGRGSEPPVSPKGQNPNQQQKQKQKQTQKEGPRGAYFFVVNCSSCNRRERKCPGADYISSQYGRTSSAKPQGHGERVVPEYCELELDLCEGGDKAVAAYGCVRGFVGDRDLGGVGSSESWNKPFRLEDLEAELEKKDVAFVTTFS